MFEDDKVVVSLEDETATSNFLEDGELVTEIEEETDD